MANIYLRGALLLVALFFFLVPYIAGGILIDAGRKEENKLTGQKPNNTWIGFGSILIISWTVLAIYMLFKNRARVTSSIGSTIPISPI